MLYETSVRDLQISLSQNDLLSYCQSLFLSRARLFYKCKYAISTENTATWFPIKWGFVLVAYFTWVYFHESQFHVHATFVVNHVCEDTDSPWNPGATCTGPTHPHPSETPRIHLKWTPRTYPPRQISIWKPRQQFLTKHACTCLINATDNIYAFVGDQRFANGLSAKSNIYLPKLGESSMRVTAWRPCRGASVTPVRFARYNPHYGNASLVYNSTRPYNCLTAPGQNGVPAVDNAGYFH